MKIDIFTHFTPPKYLKVLLEKTTLGSFSQKRIECLPTLSDLDKRLRVMDKYDDLLQVLTLGPQSSPEVIARPKDATELAKIANDELAELVERHPDRFIAAVATLPVNDMDAALKETDRAINDLKLRGVQLIIPINGKALDQPEYMPLYERMAHYNLPIWIHPRVREAPDARSADRLEYDYDISLIFGWPYQTTVTMTRLIFSGVLEKHPNLKFITHHCGAMVPYFEQRIACLYDFLEMTLKARHKQGLTKPPIEYFRMFYADTALNGCTPALMCAYAFFGADHMLFGTDMPYDNQLGGRVIRQTIQAIEQMDVPDSDKKKIFEDNARKLLRLPI